MRKMLSLCLALTLLLGLVPGAAAAETGAFASLGPYHTWSEAEKKTAFDTWSEEEWTLYWDAYDAAAWESGQYDQYWQDYFFASEEDRARFWNDFERLGPYGGWTEAEKEDAFSRWGEERWRYYWGCYYESFDWPDTSGFDADESAYWEDVERRAVREENRNEGLPYPEGNVNWNGTWLTFGETAPVARSGRLMVPFRAFLEGRGAQVAYEDGHIEARLPDGALVEMDLGETAVTVTRDDRIDTLEMDVTPYAAGGRVYLPVRFAVRSSGGDTVYALEIDGDTLAGLEPPLWSGIEGLEDALEDTREPDFDVSLTARLSADGVLEECRLNGRAALDPLLPGELTCSLEGTGLELTGELALNGRYLGRLECSFAGRMAPTEEPVHTTPGPDEKQAGPELFARIAK